MIALGDPLLGTRRPRRDRLQHEARHVFVSLTLLARAPIPFLATLPVAELAKAAEGLEK